MFRRFWGLGVQGFGEALARRLVPVALELPDVLALLHQSLTEGVGSFDRV